MERCCICLESLSNKGVELICTHTFHLVCLAKLDFSHFWKQTKSPCLCPLCRHDITSVAAVPICTSHLNLDQLLELKNHYNYCMKRWIMKEFTDTDEEELNYALMDPSIRYNLSRFAEGMSQTMKVNTRDMRCLSLNLNLQLKPTLGKSN